MKDFNIDSLDFAKADGLVAAVAQDSITGEVLMVGYQTREAAEESARSKMLTFWSRTRNTLWKKGETSGAFLEIVESYVDCDNDTVLYLVKPQGPACHTGARTCFSTEIIPNAGFLGALERIVDSRINGSDPASYVKRLVDSGLPRVAQKVGEEAVEVVIESLQADSKKVGEEAADLIFHLLVLLRTRGVSLTDVVEILAARNREPRT